MPDASTNADRLKAEIVAKVGTPAVVVDLDVVDRNIARTQALCDAAGLRNRPHMKTHKNGALARQQVAAGAIGVACQKLGEAEAMLDAGVEDILICYNILGAARSGQLAELLRRGPLKIAADNAVSLAAYSQAGAEAGRPVDVLIECDTGRQRAGVVTPAEALTLARIVRDDPHLTFKGLLLYPTGEDWPAAQRFLDETLAGLAELGLEAEIVSSGGTPNLAELGALKGATEHRAGTYIYNDRMMIECGAAEPEDCALSVYTTVVSRAAPDRGILDAGSKTLTSDTGGGLDGHGLIVEHPDARIAGFSEEHGMLDLSRCTDKPEIGEVVRVIPNHVCVVVNMVDRIVGVRDGRIEHIFSVDARGRLV
ncbi:MAG: D-TA family PLP-dependent enzyme [Acuticoccus sp.]